MIIEDELGKQTDNETTASENSENMSDDSAVETDTTAVALAALQQQLEEQRDKYLRLYAEFDTFRRRANQQKIDLMKTASRDVITALLPVIDDFERAAKMGSEPLPEGIKLIIDKMFNTLVQQGLKEMQSTGAPFDADLHEAVTEIPSPSEDLKGKVFDTIEKGYYINDVIIRYAKVVVAK